MFDIKETTQAEIKEPSSSASALTQSNTIHRGVTSSLLVLVWRKIKRMLPIPSAIKFWGMGLFLLSVYFTSLYLTSVFSTGFVALFVISLLITGTYFGVGIPTALSEGYDQCWSGFKKIMLAPFKFCIDNTKRIYQALYTEYWDIRQGR